MRPKLSAMLVRSLTLIVLTVALAASGVESQNANRVDAGRYQTVIVVNAENGTNNISCWNNSFAFPCETLNYALEGAQASNSTKILLEAGNYDLYPDTNVTEFRWAIDIALVGNSTAGSPDSNDTLVVFVLKSPFWEDTLTCVEAYVS